MPPKQYDDSDSKSETHSQSSSDSKNSDKSGGDEASRTVFVNGLEYEMKESDIEEFFQACGTIERVNLPKYQDSNKNIGYCHVRFSTKEETQKAMDLNGKYLGDRYVRIEMAKGLKEMNDSKFKIL